MTNVHELCNNYVNFIEDSWVDRIWAENKEAQRHAQNCKCPSCIRHAQNLDELLADEIDRLTPPEVA